MAPAQPFLSYCQRGAFPLTLTADRYPRLAAPLPQADQGMTVDVKSVVWRPFLLTISKMYVYLSTNDIFSGKNRGLCYKAGIRERQHSC
jgi:hypothetical protein